jgi:phage shock protein A
MMREQIIKSMRLIYKQLHQNQANVRSLYSKARDLRVTIRYKKRDWIRSTGFKDQWQVAVQNEIKALKSVHVYVQILEAKIVNMKKAVNALQRTLSKFDKEGKL